MNYRNEALTILMKGRIWTNNANNEIIVHDNGNKPTEEQVQLKIDELKAAKPMKLLREERDQLIAATDWWVLPDRTPTQAHLDYRQTLRDLPANSPNAAVDEYDSLVGVTWPVKPE